MAHLERIGRRYRVVWRDGGRGSARHKSELYANKALAERARTVIEAREGARRGSGGPVLTVAQAAGSWVAHLAAAGRSPRYIEMSQATLLRHLDPKCTLDRLEPDRLRALRIGARRVVRSCLRWSVAELGASVPPACLRLSEAGPRKRVRPDLMPDEVLQTIQAAADAWGPSYGAIVHLVGTYGHRPESLANATVADFDPERGRMRLLVKGGDRIEHPILPATIERLRACAGQRDGAERLFLDRDKKSWASGHAISIWYRSAIGRSRWKPEVGIYALKRRAISHMLGLNLDPATIASITGHRRPDVLLRHYARTNESRQQAALAALAGATPGLVAPG
jgi:integrase